MTHLRGIPDLVTLTKSIEGKVKTTFERLRAKTLRRIVGDVILPLLHQNVNVVPDIREYRSHGKYICSVLLW